MEELQHGQRKEEPMRPQEAMRSSACPTCQAQVGCRCKGGRIHKLRRNRPAVEELEQRQMLSANVLVNNTADDGVQRTQSETAIAILNGNPIVVFNDSSQYGPGSPHFTGYAYSSDGGASFTDPGTLPNSPQGDVGDPVLAQNTATGTVYLAALGFLGGPFGELPGVNVYRSTDAGHTWSQPVLVPGNFVDKEWIAVDNFAGIGQGNIYVTATDFGQNGYPIVFASSTDGGLTFSAFQSLSADFASQGSQVVVEADHSVYVFWWDSGQIVMRKSTDNGLTFSPQQTVAFLHSFNSNGDLNLGFRSNSFPSVAVNPVNGNIYVAENDSTTTGRGAIFLEQSTDGGATWSAPLQINDDVLLKGSVHSAAWMPAIAVTPDGTHLAVEFYDDRFARVAHRTGFPQGFDRFGVIATISGSTLTFGANFRITLQTSPVTYNNDPVVAGGYMGDYDQLTADNTYFYGAFVDNILNRTAQDVFFAKVNMLGQVIDPATGQPVAIPAGSQETGPAGNNQSGPANTSPLTVPFAFIPNAGIVDFLVGQEQHKHHDLTLAA